MLVTDIGLSDEDGYELIRGVRARGPERGGLPAIAISGFARSDGAKRAVAEGFQVYLPKPVDAAELVGLVSSLASATKRASG